MTTPFGEPRWSDEDDSDDGFTLEKSEYFQGFKAGRAEGWTVWRGEVGRLKDSVSFWRFVAVVSLGLAVVFGAQLFCR